MRDKTLGEVVAGLARYRAQLIPLVALLVIAFFLDGSHAPQASNAAAAARDAAALVAGAAGNQQVGAADLGAPGDALSPTGDLAYDTAPVDLSASGGSTAPAGDGGGGDTGAPAGPPALAPFTCDNDASLPQPVFAPAMEQLRSLQMQVEASMGPLPVDIAGYLAGAAMCSPGKDPLSLVVAQLGPLLSAAGPAIDVLAMVNPLLPALPVPPQIPLPPLPAQLNPVLLAAAPITSQLCGELPLASVLVAALASFPLPVTAQHLNAILDPIFALCGALIPIAPPPSQ
jgi:hypothetical protein